tara:strand:- start:30 stop:446 length:417 start_codon:yes stop_codon:yes gene_type:complete
METKTSQEIRQELSNACDDLQNSICAFKVKCGNDNWNEHTVHITAEFTEIFPNVLAKVAFPEKTGDYKSIIIKAKAGSKLDPHKMIPARFIYIIHGDQRDETGVIVLSEDESMKIHPLEESSMYFKVDTKMLMEVEVK